jgi:hypothetical protein
VCSIAAAFAREPFFRPGKATVLAWMSGHDIIVVPVADYQPPVTEPLDPAKVQDLTHVYGAIYRRFWFPHYGVADYSFRYPYRNKTNVYSARVRYDWSIRPGWIARTPESVTIVGPKNRTVP